ncbi:MAG TPA: precorrin-6A synthase (deacetylating) [Streptosporangiaceae bacterium]|nr:precorrin-6A synthase (deacetylating) [Streptosporangiaceae bacterium]
MRRLLIIGIGAGDPEQVTMQAIRALGQADVFFVIDKGAVKQDLMLLRQEICERYVQDRSYRMVRVPDPERDRAAAGYRGAVQQWRSRRAEIFQRLIRDELPDGACGAFLVWGDPSLYDSTLAIIEQIVAQGTMALEYEVVPGISSVQALAARHRVSLTQVGRPVHITTGRRLCEEGFPDGCDDVVVMLDAACSFTGIADADTEIYWGAYIGTADEVLVSGKLADVGPQIQALRTDMRARKGWIMDTYLLRRPGGR